MKARVFQTTPPDRRIALVSTAHLLAKAGSASAAYETSVFVLPVSGKVNKVFLVPNTIITGAAAGAIGFVNLWRAGVQISTDGLLGAFNFAAVSTPTTLAALGQQGVVPTRAFAFTGTIGAVTGASSTGATLTAVGSSAINNGFVTATSKLIVAPGLALEETITLSAFNTGTGIFTIAASGKFANSHPAGTLCVVAGAYLWQGTAAAITAADVGGTLTATGASLLTAGITGTSIITIDPGISTQESVTMATLNTGSGVFTSTAFASNHASGAQVVITPTAAAPLLPSLLANDVVTFKWLQLGTGLALPESKVFVDYGI